MQKFAKKILRLSSLCQPQLIPIRHDVDSFKHKSRHYIIPLSLLSLSGCVCVSPLPIISYAHHREQKQKQQEEEKKTDENEENLSKLSHVRTSTPEKFIFCCIGSWVKVSCIIFYINSSIAISSIFCQTRNT